MWRRRSAMGHSTVTHMSRAVQTQLWREQDVVLLSSDGASVRDIMSIGHLRIARTLRIGVDQEAEIGRDIQSVDVRTAIIRGG
jgi:hypothetical protein